MDHKKAKEWKPPWQNLNEKQELNAKQEQTRKDLLVELSSGWPGVLFRVEPTLKRLRRGEPYIPPEDEMFRVWFENGPPVQNVEELIDGRTRICGNVATFGAILWISDQPILRNRLNRAAPKIVGDLDLSEKSVMDEITSNDLWVEKAGFPRHLARDDEGYEVLVAAQTTGIRENGYSWPSSKTT